jgi:DnaJ-class molecular chaperone
MTPYDKRQISYLERRIKELQSQQSQLMYKQACAAAKLQKILVKNYKCKECNGLGKVHVDEGLDSWYLTCGECHGNGYIITEDKG